MPAMRETGAGEFCPPIVLSRRPGPRQPSAALPALPTNAPTEERSMHKVFAAASATLPSCDCEADPIACLERLFVELVQRRRIDRGQSPARRPVFVQTHGVAHGRFVIVPDLPEPLWVGLF